MNIPSITSGPVPSASSDGTRRLAQAAPAASSFVSQKTTVAGTDAATQAPSPENVAQTVKQVNDAFAQNGQNLFVSLEKDKATGIDLVIVQDKNTHEVISQFPPKEIIAIAEAISQSLEKKGLMMHVSA